MKSIYQALSELEKNNESAALCTVVKSEGSTPRHVGSKLLVYPDSHILGTVGGGELESRVIKAELESLETGNAQTLSYPMADPSRRQACAVELWSVRGTDPSLQ
jgi:xanthine dehydrogenase accessory factor